ncbi:SpoVR family protein [Alkalibacillus almallahensis]|uniref:SpoVR family protein n=1 Tax=Alkalibacillus almallahensis TaxID=1379154 RepID=UPI001424906D|nr:SpoVR family protein [Alkalibacillus almallahensis]NIK12682.1 spore cortex formation protein SpoVR/YcgB (stage V sporulation) [Alkalibacillus almallahensis]
MQKVDHEWLEAAVDLGLSPQPFHIEMVSSASLDELQQKGYAKRLTLHKPSHASTKVTELFDIVDQTVYIRDDQPEHIKILITAHCLAHADFINQNHYIVTMIQAFKEQYPVMRRQFEQAREQLSHYDFLSLNHSLYDLYQFIHIHEEDVEWILTNMNLNAPLVKLWRVFDFENLLFKTIGQTSLMNEGWATLYERLLLRHNHSYTPAVEKVVNEKNRPYPTGINLYRLGEKLWEEVDENQRFRIRSIATDSSFLERFYSPTIHYNDLISILHPSQKGARNNYPSVKQQLQVTARYQGKLRIDLDRESTLNKNEVTFRYPKEQYHDIKIRKIIQSLEALLKHRVYIKPI